MPKKIACDSCHKKKISCEGGPPRCEWCIHRGIECTFTRGKIRRTSEYSRYDGPPVPDRSPSSQTTSSTRSPQTPITYPHNSNYYSAHESPSFQSNSGTSYGSFYFAGADLGNINSENGTPVFSEAGRQWIQAHTGVGNAFSQVYNLRVQARTPLFPLDGLVINGQCLNQLVPRHSVDQCASVFLGSPLRFVWPVLDPIFYHQTIRLAYEPTLSQDSCGHGGARMWVLAFVALLSTLEADKLRPLGLDPALCAAHAEQLALSALSSPTHDGLEAVTTLCVYRDFCGQTQSAATLLSLAVRCVLLFKGHSLSESRPRTREIFWLCYWVDKHISLRTGQPPVFNDSDCDLTLPEGYTTYADLMLSSGKRLMYPSDLRLTIIKSRVFSEVYSEKAKQKSDMQLICDIRDLDDELEAWRISIPEAFRPSLSKVTDTLSLQVEEGPKMLIIFIHLEYYFLLAGVHRACGRCRMWRDGGANELGALRSSLHLSVKASRATLYLLRESVWDVHSESLWLILFYLIWPAVTIFCNILFDPGSEEAVNDLNLLKLLPRLIRGIPSRQLTPMEEAQSAVLNAFFAEMVRLVESIG